MNDVSYTTTLRALMMPADTNHQGTVFGGVILSRIDQAGYLEARQNGPYRWVTVAMESVKFHAPVFTGDVVSFLTHTTRLGTTSVGVEVRVVAERRDTLEEVLVTEAQLTMVAVDDECRPTPFAQPNPKDTGA